MKSILKIIAGLMLFGICGSATATDSPSPNFIGADNEIRQAAEMWRGKITEFWIGEKFPKWSSPCRITTKMTGHPSGGGTTTFYFNEGQVYGWDMNVSGSRKAIIENVIPHEVSHTVIATIVLRPNARWLNEGVCTLWEPKSEQQLHFNTAYFARHRSGQVFRFIDSMKYPTTPQQLGDLYATGYTLVEWLIGNYGKEKLLEFMKDPRAPSQKFATHFGISTQDAEQEWLKWLVANYQTAPTYFGETYVAARSNTSLPTLHVVTASWCPPCRQFWNDVNRDKGFRAAIESRVNLVKIDGDTNRQWAVSRGATSYPSFLLNEKVVFVNYGTGRVLDLKARKHNFVTTLDRFLDCKPVSPAIVSTPSTVACNCLEEIANLRNEINALRVNVEAAGNYETEMAALRARLAATQSDLLLLSNQERRVILKDADGNITGDKSYKIGETITLRGIFKTRKE